MHWTRLPRSQGSFSLNRRRGTIVSHSLMYFTNLQVTCVQGVWCLCSCLCQTHLGSCTASALSRLRSVSRSLSQTEQPRRPACWQLFTCGFLPCLLWAICLLRRCLSLNCSFCPSWNGAGKADPGSNPSSMSFRLGSLLCICKRGDGGEMKWGVGDVRAQGTARQCQQHRCRRSYWLVVMCHYLRGHVHETALDTNVAGLYLQNVGCYHLCPSAAERQKYENQKEKETAFILPLLFSRFVL